MATKMVESALAFENMVSQGKILRATAFAKIRRMPLDEQLGRAKHAAFGDTFPQIEYRQKRIEKFVKSLERQYEEA
jgi:hypothetical protein